MTRLYGSGSSSPDIVRLKQDGDIPALIRHLSSSHLTVQWHAAEALGTCGEAAVPLLLSALRSPVIPVRLGAAEALGAIRDRAAVSPLLGVVHHDPSLEVRWAAVLALGEIGSPDVVPFLVPVLRDPNRYLRYGAEFSPAVLAGRKRCRYHIPADCTPGMGECQESGCCRTSATLGPFAR